VFTLSGGTWTYHSKLIAPDGVTGDEFGISIAVSDTGILVGARGDDDIADNAGNASRLLLSPVVQYTVANM
jgi:hypothetical protein